MTELMDNLNALRKTQWQVKYNSPSPEDIKNFRRYLGQFANLVRATRGEGSVFSSPCGLAGLPSLLTDEILDELDLLLKGSTTYEYMICRHALEWAGLCDQKHAITRNLENLFRFPMELIRRRVMLYYDKGFVEIGDAAIPVLHWLSWPEEPVPFVPSPVSTGESGPKKDE